MSEIRFRQTSPAGTAMIDTARLVIGTDGALFLKSAGAPLPLSEQQIAVVREHFGGRLEVAINAMQALA